MDSMHQRAKFVLYLAASAIRADTTKCVVTRDTALIVSLFVVMSPPANRCIGGVMFSGCPFIRAWVRPGVSTPISTMCCKPTDGISPNFG